MMVLRLRDNDRGDLPVEVLLQYCAELGRRDQFDRRGYTPKHPLTIYRLVTRRLGAGGGFRGH